MTTIHFERSGGMTGRDVQLDLELDQIPEEQAQAIQNLLLQADFFKLPGDLQGTAGPDAHSYVIRVKAGQSEHTVRVDDANMPESLSPLVSALAQMRPASDGRVK